MPAEDTFGERLVAAMVLAETTVAELTEALGVSERSVWRWRSGVAVPGAEALPMLARALKTTPHRLLGWEDAS